MIDLAYVARHFLGRSYPTVMNQIRAEFGLDLPPEFEDQCRARLMAAFAEGLKIMPHVREVLEAIDMPYCVATSSSPMCARTSLDLVRLSHLTGGRLFTATMVDRGKPAPDLFLLCAARHGADPSRCLVIEDSENGVRATKGDQFDVLTIGTYEVPIWGKNGWLVALDDLPADYDKADLLPAIAGGLTVDGHLYASPFYGESSMVM
jgi:HAD superfamily hydrolase (TIGR01509 family)